MSNTIFEVFLGIVCFTLGFSFAGTVLFNVKYVRGFVTGYLFATTSKEVREALIDLLEQAEETKKQTSSGQQSFNLEDN